MHDWQAVDSAPVRRWIWSSKSLLSCVQRPSSPASAPSSALAAAMRRAVDAASSSSACFCLIAASKRACAGACTVCHIMGTCADISEHMVHEAGCK